MGPDMLFIFSTPNFSPSKPDKSPINKYPRNLPDIKRRSSGKTKRLLSFFSSTIKGTSTGAQENIHTGPLDNPNKRASINECSIKNYNGLLIFKGVPLKY
jgi:hypothetical protein